MCHSSAGVSNRKRFPVGRANGSGDGVREWPSCAAMLLASSILPDGVGKARSSHRITGSSEE